MTRYLVASKGLINLKGTDKRRFTVVQADNPEAALRRALTNGSIHFPPTVSTVARAKTIHVMDLESLPLKVYVFEGQPPSSDLANWDWNDVEEDDE